MAKSALSVRRVEGIGEGSLLGTLSRLLQLTCEAVLVFDGAGRILLANDEAAELFGAERGAVGSDVRLLFPSADVAPQGVAFAVEDLPFATDGSMTEVLCLGAAGQPVSVRVRCDSVNAPGATYLLVALASERDARVDREGERALDDLRRANHRLSGTLKIVLDTIDSTDIAALFERVLEELTQTMEADGTIVYLAEADGFHLRGVSSDLAGEKHDDTATRSPTATTSSPHGAVVYAPVGPSFSTGPSFSAGAALCAVTGSGSSSRPQAGTLNWRIHSPTAV